MPKAGDLKFENGNVLEFDGLTWQVKTTTWQWASQILSAALPPINFAPPVAPKPTFADVKDALDRYQGAFGSLSTGAINDYWSKVMNEKPAITSTGAAGFSEKGAPDSWDMAVGEVYGYRWWTILIPATLAGFLDATPCRDIKTHLTGANIYSWRDGKQEARCTSPRVYWSAGYPRKYTEHLPPEIREACGCGFWAYFDKDLDVREHFSRCGTEEPYHGFSADTVEIPVFGVIKGTGRVIIGEKGFRSQYAEIVGLCLPEITKKQLSWWTREVMEDYDEPQEVLTRNMTPGGVEVFRKMTGRETRSRLTKLQEKCSPSEQLTRVAEVEATLSGTYPSVRIFSDHEALTGYYPPDKNYAS